MPGQPRGLAKLTALFELPADTLTITAAPPEMISQRNVEAVTGIPARVYLEEVRAPGFPLPVVKLGKLRLVSRAAFVAYLESLASQPGQRRAPTSARTDADEVAAVLAEVGFKPLPANQPRASLLPPRAASRGKSSRR